MPLARHDFFSASFSSLMLNFYSHASCEAWLFVYLTIAGFNNFYSHASCEAWLLITMKFRKTQKFLLTCLLRGMTRLKWCGAPEIIFLLTCLLRGMTRTYPWCSRTDFISTHMPLARHDSHPVQRTDSLVISTHMPLARHDGNNHLLYGTLEISTHMPLARHDNSSIHCTFKSSRFLLTCLLRGMTRAGRDSRGNAENFYSHASCEAWHGNSSLMMNCQNFYSHASCEAWRGRIRNGPDVWNFYSHASCEAWPDAISGVCIVFQFLLTCLLRGMTKRWIMTDVFTIISTHMPLARHDMRSLARSTYFGISTHMPLARHDITWFTYVLSPATFLLTCLLRGMTKKAYRLKSWTTISTHMPLARHDVISPKLNDIPSLFLLTCLLRGMTHQRRCCGRLCGISTHMPLARHDLLKTT